MEDYDFLVANDNENPEPGFFAKIMVLWDPDMEVKHPECFDGIRDRLNAVIVCTADEARRVDPEQRNVIIKAGGGDEVDNIEDILSEGIGSQGRCLFTMVDNRV